MKAAVHPHWLIIILATDWFFIPRAACMIVTAEVIFLTISNCPLKQEQ
jgi:hypothetical protein